MFEGFKHFHMTMAILSMAFLILRFAVGLRGSEGLNKKWLKITPHIVDFLLILSIAGMIYSAPLSLYPAGFVAEKLTFFILYIVFSVLCVLALRGRLKASFKVPMFALALLSWLWLIHVAFSKSPVLFG